MKFAGLEEMEKLREEMRQVMLLGYDPHYKCSPIEDRTDLLVDLINTQGSLISKVCHAGETQSEQIKTISKEMAQIYLAQIRHDERIAELEAWRKQTTGDGR